MNELATLNFEHYKVRHVLIDNEPWWVAKDVCDVLGLSNVSDSVSRLDDDEKGIANTDTLGGLQNMTIISEPGLYKLIQTSRKPEAKRFDTWVRHEVLPTIRKTGQYMMQNNMQMIPQDLAIDMAKAAGKEIGKKLAKGVVDELDPRITHLENDINFLKKGVKPPKRSALVNQKIINVWLAEGNGRCPATNEPMQLHDIEIDKYRTPDKYTIYNSWPIKRWLNRAFNHGKACRDNYLDEFRRWQNLVKKHYPPSNPNKPSAPTQIKLPL